MSRQITAGFQIFNQREPTLPPVPSGRRAMPRHLFEVMSPAAFHGASSTSSGMPSSEASNRATLLSLQAALGSSSPRCYKRSEPSSDRGLLYRLEEAGDFDLDVEQDAEASEWGFEWERGIAGIIVDTMSWGPGVGAPEESEGVEGGIDRRGAGKGNREGEGRDAGEEDPGPEGGLVGASGRDPTEMTAEEEMAIPREHRCCYLEHRGLCAAIIQHNPYGAPIGQTAAAWEAILEHLSAAGFFLHQTGEGADEDNRLVEQLGGPLDCILELKERGKPKNRKKTAEEEHAAKGLAMRRISLETFTTIRKRTREILAEIVNNVPDAEVPDT
ncbi:hypothetical protein FN846DRAFT_903494 [Sphaerosporella brunnea]|uniref:Uncharacterized protein n=1 Tax=Sphaerosporella brunnea TaxID=1250544 RepID=A0A5J5F765_9PEZI|nr:hypothetical protein FN846DRAFT_903494 [Sphaerosporella brunnea]